MSETKEPWEVEQIERKNTKEMNEIAHNPLERGTRNIAKNLEVERHKKRVTMDKKYMQALR